MPGLLSEQDLKDLFDGQDECVNTVYVLKGCGLQTHICRGKHQNGNEMLNATTFPTLAYIGWHLLLFN